MQKLSSKKLLGTLFTLLSLLVVAKAVATFIWWYLPSKGIELADKNSYTIPYQRVDFKNMLAKVKQTKESLSAQKKEKSSSSLSIDNLVLKGLYGNENYGYAIVAKKVTPKKTEIIAVGETFEGYKLFMIEINQVIFTKASKEYVLKLEESKIKESQQINRVKNKKSSYRSASNTEKEVTRADINAYAKNPAKIWKDISIIPLKKSGKIRGFKVTRIKKGSKMAELGLQKGDVIVEANNIKLASFKDAIKLYKNINKLDTISLIVERNNEEKEIIYEIR
jgi:type II secretion system protein C